MGDANSRKMVTFGECNALPDYSSDFSQNLKAEKGFCFGKLAVQDNNLLDCNIDSQSSSGDIYNLNNGCVQYFAFETKDINVCNAQGINFDQASCYGYYALKSNDFNICDGLANVYPENLPVNCYYYLADKIKDVNVCNNLLGTTYWSNCISEVANVNKDSSICLLISDSDFEKDSCLSNIRTIDSCNGITDSNAQKYLCIISVVSENKDTTVCSNISDQNVAYYCKHCTIEQINPSDENLCSKGLIIEE